MVRVYHSFAIAIAEMAAFITREQAEISGETDTVHMVSNEEREQGDL